MLDIKELADKASISDQGLFVGKQRYSIPSQVKRDNANIDIKIPIERFSFYRDYIFTR